MGRFGFAVLRRAGAASDDEDDNRTPQGASAVGDPFSVDQSHVSNQAEFAASDQPGGLSEQSRQGLSDVDAAQMTLVERPVDVCVRSAKESTDGGAATEWNSHVNEPSFATILVSNMRAAAAASTSDACVLPQPLSPGEAVGAVPCDDEIIVRAYYPHDPHTPQLSPAHLAQVVDLLGRRCTAGGKELRATRTLVPLVQRLAHAASAATQTDLSMTEGIHGRKAFLDAHHIRLLQIELLVAFGGGQVKGAALLTKSPTGSSSRGFVVLQLLAVQMDAENRTLRAQGIRLLSGSLFFTTSHYLVLLPACSSHPI